MEKKFLSLILFSLLLTSCQNNIYLTSELKYDEYKLSLQIFNEEEEKKQFTKSLNINETLGSKCVSLYNDLLSSNTQKRIFAADGFTATNYYYCSFKGEYNTSLLIHKDDNYKIKVSGYNINYNSNTYVISSINNNLKLKIDNLIPLLKNALENVEWEETHNYC